MSNGAPGGIRTPDHLVRSQILYPAELRAHFGNKNKVLLYKIFSQENTIYLYKDEKAVFSFKVGLERLWPFEISLKWLDFYIC
jgi:hypothetical protein